MMAFLSAFQIIILLIVILLMILFIFWIWILIDCLKSKMHSNEKLIWVIIIVFFNILGAILYLFFSKSSTPAHKVKHSKEIYRSKRNKILAGVCGGLAEYFDIDAALMRTLWVLLTITTGIIGGILLYIIAAILLPEK